MSCCANPLKERYQSKLNAKGLDGISHIAKSYGSAFRGPPIHADSSNELAGN